MRSPTQLFQSQRAAAGSLNFLHGQASCSASMEETAPSRIAHPALPALPPGRRRRGRRALSHHQRRIVQHYSGYLDPERLQLANMNIGLAGWARLFGDPNAISHDHVVPVLRFPERRSDSRSSEPRSGN